MTQIVGEEQKEEAGKAAGLLQDVYFCALDSKDVGVLWEIEPAYVIVYDPDISFVRQLEVLLTQPLHLSIIRLAPRQK